MNNSKVERNAAGLSSQKVGESDEKSPGHVCTAACIHPGAKIPSGAAKTGNESVSMGSPEVGLGGHSAPKDAVHKYT